jgi:hypothetical protein
MLRRLALFLACAVAISAAASAQTSPSIVYPAKGQSPEQVEKDKGECHMWAVKESGFDPAARSAPAPTITVQQPAQQPSGPSGERLRGAARGAAVGAVVGEVANDDAGSGAAAGAAGGAMIGGMKQRQQARAAAQQPTTATQPNPEYEQYLADKARYDGAVKACLIGRGYTLS